MKRNSYRHWTTEEMCFVEQHYGTLLVSEIGKRLGRSFSSVKSMARRLGCNSTYDFWTEAEKAILTTHYAEGVDFGTVMAMLPGRSEKAIFSMIQNLGIIRRQWLQNELDIMEKYYPSEGVKTARRLPGRTESAVSNQAHAMKLRYSRLRQWNDEELKLLERNKHLPLAEITHFFTGRSKMSVYHAYMKIRRKP